MCSTPRTGSSTCSTRLKDPSHPLFDPKLASKLGLAIDDHYAEMDGIIGQTLAACDDETALIICSDHGIGSYSRSVHLNRFLAQAGYLSLKKHDPDRPGGAFRPRGLEKDKSLCPGLRFHLSEPGRPGKTRPWSSRANRPRELAHGIAADLMKLKDGSAQAIAGVHHKSDIYSGPLTEQAPEMVVGYHLPYRVSWPTAIGGQGPEIFEDNTQKMVRGSLRGFRVRARYGRLQPEAEDRRTAPSDPVGQNGPGSFGSGIG